MNIEELNKSQIVLLTLLVSFVTSIATGIVTVSLMDQAPPVIAQTVNRVIERTVETVVPASQSGASAVTLERTVVVRESELISKAVAAVSPSIVRLYATTSEDAPLLGFGVVLNTEGAIMADTASIGKATTIIVAHVEGARIPATVTGGDDSVGLVFLQATSTGTKVTWKPAVVAGGPPLLGQSVVTLAGKSALRVGDGIVTALVPLEEEAGTLIDTNIGGETIMAGSPLVNTEGEVIGVSTVISRTSSAGGFISSSVLMKQAKSEAGEAATE